MPEQILSNPGGVLGGTPTYPTTTQAYYNSSTTLAIAAGDVVVWVWDETARTLKVKVSEGDDADDAALVAGVAFEAITVSTGAKPSGLIVIDGFAMVNIGSGTSATAGDLATLGATASAIALAVDGTAALVTGDYFGTFLGNEDGALDKAPVWVGHV